MASCILLLFSCIFGSIFVMVYVAHKCLYFFVHFKTEKKKRKEKFNIIHLLAVTGATERRHVRDKIQNPNL